MTLCSMKYNTKEAVIEGVLLKECSEKFCKIYNEGTSIE